jgi:hypothetical protein
MNSTDVKLAKADICKGKCKGPWEGFGFPMAFFGMPYQKQ